MDEFKQKYTTFVTVVENVYIVLFLSTQRSTIDLWLDF